MRINWAEILIVLVAMAWAWGWLRMRSSRKEPAEPKAKDSVKIQPKDSGYGRNEGEYVDFEEMK